MRIWVPSSDSSSLQAISVFWCWATGLLNKTSWVSGITKSSSNDLFDWLLGVEGLMKETTCVSVFRSGSSSLQVVSLFWCCATGFLSGTSWVSGIKKSPFNEVLDFSIGIDGLLKEIACVSGIIKLSPSLVVFVDGGLVSGIKELSAVVSAVLFFTSSS